MSNRRLATAAAAGALFALGWSAAAQTTSTPGPAAAFPAATPEAEAQEAANSKAWNANPAPSDPRDFQGVWYVRRLYRGFLPLTGAPVDRPGSHAFIPKTPLQLATEKKRIEMAEAGTPLVQASADCLPHGTPRIMLSNYPIQIDYGPGVIVMLHEITHDIRVIHMDGKPAPADEPLTFMGYSRGRWEGNTLIVETDHLNDQTSLDEEGLSHGAKLTVREEFTRYVNRWGGTELRDEITITDPDYYTRPWTSEKLFAWRGDLGIAEYSCEENNRNQSENGVTVAR